jgi:hypothetical protein
VDDRTRMNARIGANFASLGPITKQYGEEATFGLDVTYEF